MAWLLSHRWHPPRTALLRAAREVDPDSKRWKVICARAGHAQDEEYDANLNQETEFDRVGVSLPSPTLDEDYDADDVKAESTRRRADSVFRVLKDHAHIFDIMHG